jgi:voltage-gated potassium channel
MHTGNTRSPSFAYQFFMLILCAYALGGLALQTLVSSPETRHILAHMDDVVCVLFLIDFFICLHRAPNRWKYMMSWGWLDLLSSIPSVVLFRWGRAVRVVRILKVIRGFRATKTISQIILQHRAENTFLAVATVT